MVSRPRRANRLAPCHHGRVGEPDAAGAAASVVIPAHDEEATIERLLRGLLAGAAGGEFDVVVVCNGCTDRTAELAGRAHPDVRVVETPEPSKHRALRLGDATTDVFPRVYLDADVELTTRDLRVLLQALAGEGIHAAGPERVIPRDRVSPAVRSYYRVWERLPQVREGLFGRGVIAVDREGFERVGALPDRMSDDLAVSEAFGASERA